MRGQKYLARLRNGSSVDFNILGPCPTRIKFILFKSLNIYFLNKYNYYFILKNKYGWPCEYLGHIFRNINEPLIKVQGRITRLHHT